MAKGEDAVLRKRKKAQRKKLGKDCGVSARVAAAIAAKRRRKAGKRRICEGMCFFLPTPEDPFNDRHDKKSVKNVESKNDKHDKKSAKSTKSMNKIERLPKHKNDPTKITYLKDIEMVDERPINNSVSLGKNEHISCLKATFVRKAKESEDSFCESLLGPFSDSCSLSKFLVLCLNAIQTAWVDEGTFNAESDQPLLANEWGIEFWKGCSNGSDILETSEAGSSREQLAWLISTASDILSRKEKEDSYVPIPFLLVLVPSKEAAQKVRSLCKPLKAFGIHTVSLHPEASIGHQVKGLRTCDPEFIISTPERLLELVALDALDLSCVSLLVLDGFESRVGGRFVESLKLIKDCISTNVQTVVFDWCHSNSLNMQELLIDPILRLSADDF